MRTISKKCHNCGMLIFGNTNIDACPQCKTSFVEEKKDAEIEQPDQPEENKAPKAPEAPDKPEVFNDFVKNGKVTPGKTTANKAAKK